jgi:hypothetical protein
MKSTHDQLVSEVCGANYMLEGGEPVLIKPDSEYPDWLFKMDVSRPLPPLEQQVSLFIVVTHGSSSFFQHPYPNWKAD